MSASLKPFVVSSKTIAKTPNRLNMDMVASYEVGPETPADTGSSGIFTILFTMAPSGGGRPKVVTWKYKVKDEMLADLAALDTYVNYPLV